MGPGIRSANRQTTGNGGAQSFRPNATRTRGCPTPRQRDYRMGVAMMHELIMFFSTIWDLWCLPFSIIPYGDPYLAAATVFCIAGLAVKKFINS